MFYRFSVFPFYQGFIYGEITFETCKTKALWSADRWLHVMNKSGMFLTDLEESNRLVLGRIMINSYMALAASAVEQKEWLFRLRPKFHLLHHATIDCRESRLSPNVASCWTDEDAIKHWMRVKRCVHKKTASTNVLNRFLLSLPAQLEHGLQKAAA